MVFPLVSFLFERWIMTGHLCILLCSANSTIAHCVLDSIIGLQFQLSGVKGYAHSSFDAVSLHVSRRVFHMSCFAYAGLRSMYCGYMHVRKQKYKIIWSYFKAQLLKLTVDF